jgi:hypothetical protein
LFGEGDREPTPQKTYPERLVVVGYLTQNPSTISPTQFINDV